MTYKILAEVVDITADDKAKTMPSLFVGSIYRVFPNGERQHVISGPAAYTPELAYADVKKYADMYSNEGLHVMTVFPNAEKEAA